MNRFRNKKKGKDAVEGESSSMSLKGFFSGKKVQEEEVKEEVDLTTALPSHDEFRTSLLMTGLSARFSMLREQDDPSTKIGKASDDSVLFPKHSSRLLDYGFQGDLNDIAEVESLRTPFGGRLDMDDASSTKGSIMSRGKPTDGNNLFGGRQKIVIGNRTLYESDVSMSAFQKWRREERERQRRSQENEREDSQDSQDPSADTRPRPSEEGSAPMRSESPAFIDYNQKRGTSSTTASSLARNSTAATSVNSQAAASIKDWQPQPSAPASANVGATLDRSVTRTRRLYEQALHQDMHDQQSTALSRIDTLTGKRPFATRSPDLSSSTTISPTGFTPLNERRAMLTKASAPNLRTTASPTTAPPPPPTDMDSKVSSPAESRSNLVGTPPISPPISEAGEFSALAIQPNDRGKATALGVFQKPAQQYDESKYAQRQLQLQQGRETPTHRTRTESNATGRSRSSSTSERQQFAPKLELSIHTESSRQGYGSQTFLDTSETEDERVPDEVHPAFRQTALPTPQSFTSRASTEPSPVFEKPEYPLTLSHNESPEESPMLSPPSGSGLGGMVRQHMRSESGASSIYAAPQSAGVDTRFLTDARDSSVLGNMISGLRASTLESSSWNPYGDDSRTRDTLLPIDESFDKLKQEDSVVKGHESKPSNDEDNDFASQLANARRRVQERLVSSYAESESSRPTSPLPALESPNEPPAKFGLLRGKSSRGSLIDRNRDTSGGPKPLKLLGLGSVTMSTSPGPAKQTFDDAGLPPMKEEEAESSSGRVSESTDAGARRSDDRDADAASTVSNDRDDDNVHPGLRAFRNARRELQRRKELETLGRHHGSNQSTGGSSVEDYRMNDGETGSRAASRERGPPPRSYYQRRDPSQDSRRSVASRSPPRGERDRSGSEASNSRAGSRPPPPRLRTNSSAYDLSGQGPMSAGPMLRQPMVRSPGLPGTDIRRSPIMPPQPYPGSSPSRFERSASSGNLRVQSERPTLDMSGSPMSPSVNGLPPSPRLAGPRSGASPIVPVGGAQRRPSAPPAPSPGGSTTNSTLQESMKKVIKKKDISDPTFVMSTSRVPTVSLQDNGESGQRSRNGSKSSSNGGEYIAPPLPPINPRRTNRMTGFLGRKHSDAEDPDVRTESFARSTPALSIPSNRTDGGDIRSAFSVSDDEDDKPLSRWRLRKPSSEASKVPPPSAIPNPFGSPRDTRGFAAAGPPASRHLVTPAAKPSSSSSKSPYGNSMI
ncbi:hypothetical protein RB601_002701 [Gaeumannomyces tritici]